jgi:PKD repeat protein
VEYPNIVDLEYPYVPELSFAWKHGLLKSKEVYNESGTLLSKTVNCYNSVDDTTNRRFMGFLRAVQEPDHNSSAVYNKYQIMRGWNHLDYTISFQYDENGENPIIDTTYYYYDNPKHLQVTRKSNIKSNGDQIITKIYYPQDFNETIPDKFNAMGKAIKAMADTLHMHSNILESLVFQKKQGEEEELISGTATSYKRQRENQVLPSQILQIEMDEPITDFKVWASDTSYTYDERYSKIGEYQKYDIYGNILQTKDVSEVITSYKWGYNNTLPVAKVINAEYDDIGGTFPNYYWPDTARGSKYQYLIPWGISIVKDVNNLTTIYSYDHYGRLSAIYDHEGNTINQYTYNYYISDSISNPPTSISASKESIINCETISLSVVGGTLGEGASWEWYTGSEGGTYAGSGSAINVTPSQNTIYYVRAEGYNKTSSVSKSITVSQPSLSVYPTTLNYSYTGNVGDPDSVIISYQGCYSTSVSESLDWITPQTYSGGFSITCSSNSNPTSRNGNITVSDGNISGVIQVSQDAYVVQADFTYSTPKDPTLVKFIDTSTGDPTSWAWDFDNNGTTDSTLQNPQHTFSGGNHYVKLTASKSGSSDFIVKLVVVID